MNNKTNIAIYCKDCKKMFYACIDDPLTIVDDAEIIKRYSGEGHVIKKYQQ